MHDKLKSLFQEATWGQKVFVALVIFIVLNEAFNAIAKIVS